MELFHSYFISTHFIQSFTIEVFQNNFYIPVAIHKSGDTNNIKNYGPLTKLSIIPKIVKAIVSKK